MGVIVPEESPEFDLSVDWNEVPLLAWSLIAYSGAYHRCSPVNPELKTLRKQAVRMVTDGIDGVLRPAGYARSSLTSLTWAKGPLGTAAPDAPAPDPGPLPRWEGLLAWLTGRGASRPVLPFLSRWGNDGAVCLSLQKDRYGTGIFVNVHVRNAGRHDPHGHAVAGGDRRYRSQNFLPDLPRNYVLDLYRYTRLVEDPRYLTFLLNLVEDRILPFMEAYADTSTPLARLPLASEIAEGRPLRLPENERRRLFEFAPTPDQYEAYARLADFFSFALRDGRAFQGAIKSVAGGRFLLSWDPDPVPGITRPVPPDEWVSFDQIDPGSLSYRDRETRATVVVDLSVQIRHSP